MDISDDEIQRCAQKWLRVAIKNGEFPVILMPFDPEGTDEYDPTLYGRRRAENPPG